MKTWFASWKPYFSLYRLKAMQETQYRAAALGGLVTQAFFGLLYVFLYTALFRGENQAELAETITYVWLQQMFFRVLLMNDTELIQQVMTGGLAYAVLRPVDQYRFAFVRNMAQRHVNALMRLVPMIALQFLLPTAWRMQPPESLLALMQAFVSLLIGVMNLCAIAGISGAILMQTMDNRGINAIITFISNAFAGNIIPLTLFPDSVQALIRYQPFAQSLDAPIRMYLHAQAAGEWALNIGVQLLWLMLLGRFTSVGQWSGSEIMFFFGMMQMTFAITECVGRGLAAFSQVVQGGEFDQILLRPRNLLVQVLCSRADPRRLSTAALGIVLMWLSVTQLGIPWTLGSTVLLLISVAGTVLMLLGLFLVEATLCFLSVQSIEAVNILTYGGRTACEYPVDIYPRPIRLLFMYVAPFGLCMHVPVSALLHHPMVDWPAWTAYLAPLAGAMFFLLMALVWRKVGVKRYCSTGS